MSETSENDNIKRRYPNDDFNPFKLFLWLTLNKYHLGNSCKILVVGNTDRFKESIIRGFRDAARNGGVTPPSVIDFGDYLEATTASGTIVRFMALEDNGKEHMKFHEQCEWSTFLGLCQLYTSPQILNVIRNKAPTVEILDFSKNNS